ncbi:MAG: OsmC family peroxiredoxin [Bacillati bacterium ANGP1]|uniref:OsmC family peroxiredoxin n=1 Tax=Candidatus Segetimicrobium genomatis TaxID=2569760 RepID=A0A537M961_9BACT|nr:MAG: OsmC family peroxiredoxin [Terrabacteria group bacterium ANGP1]
MAATRRADVTWEGDLLSGGGVVTAASSGAFRALPVSWAARTESPQGRTSPEELIAAAHASCFAMALSFGLAGAGKPPRKLEVSATVTFDKVEAGWRVTSSALTVRADVPGMDTAGFRKAAEAAKDGCPVSQALKGNVKLSLEATLVR